VGIRETLNQNPAITTGATIGIIVLTLVLVLYLSMGGGPSVGGQVSAKAFFTIDDGKNYFVDDAAKIPPFDYQGKQAVRAYVFSCNGTKKVEYLQRYTPEAKKKLEAATANKGRPDFGIMDQVQFTGVEVKKPGDKDWVKQNDERAVKVMQPQCNGTLELVSP